MISSSGENSKDHYFEVTTETKDIQKISGRSASFTIATSIAKGSILIVTTGILARFIPPDEFSVIALAMPLLAIATHISQLGLAHSIAQRSYVKHFQVSMLFWLSVILGSAAWICFYAIGLFAVNYFQEPRISAVYFSLGAAVFLGAIYSPVLAIYWRQLRIREVQIISILSVIISCALAVFAGYYGASYWAVVVQQITLPLCNGVILAVRMGWTPSAPSLPVWKEVRDFIAFGGHIAIFTLLYQLSQSLNVIIAGRNLAAADISHYYRTWNISRLPGSLLLTPLGGTFIPALSRLREHPAEFRALYLKNLSRILIITVPIGLALSISANDIVALLLGPLWLDASPLLAIFGLRVLWGALSESFRWILCAQDQTNKLSLLGIVLTITAFTSMFIGIRYGIQGLAIAWITCEFFVLIGLSGYFVCRHSPIDLTDLIIILCEITIYASALVFAAHLFTWIIPSESIHIKIITMFVAFMVVITARVFLQKELRNYFFSLVGISR
jgi:PST family polysaccharide transporter